MLVKSDSQLFKFKFDIGVWYQHLKPGALYPARRETPVKVLVILEGICYRAKETKICLKILIEERQN